MQLYSGHDHCPADPVDDGWPCSVLPFNAGVRTAICVLLKHKKQGGFVLAYFGRVFSACCICGFYSILLLGSSSGFFFWLVTPEEIAESTVFDWVLALFEVG